MSLLGSGEQERLKRQSPRKRRQFLAARTLSRRALSYLASPPPDRWEIATSGRPEIYSPDTSLNLSISHSGTTVVCGITTTGRIGIDLEPLAQERDWVSMAESVYTPAEIQQIKKSPAVNPRFHFLAYWTLKEAYSKASGMSLDEALQQVQIDWKHPNTPRISIKNTKQPWLFGLYLFNQQLISFCWNSEVTKIPDFYYLTKYDSPPTKIQPEEIFLI